MSDVSDFSSETWRCRWVCADPVAITARQAGRLSDILAGITASDVNLAPVNSLGAEIKAAYIAVDSGELGSGDNEYWQQKCRVLFMRPAIEPIFLSYFPKVVELRLDLAGAQKLVSALIAKEPMLREREGVGRSANGNVGFELPQRARGWLDRLKAAHAQPELATFMPMYTFAATIMAHPFADGNGRLARLLTLGALSKLAGWNCPRLGLAPSFYRHAEAMGAALDTVSLDGDWDAYIDVFLTILEDAQVLAAKLKGG